MKQPEVPNGVRSNVVVWCRIKIWSNRYRYIILKLIVVVWCRIKIWSNYLRGIVNIHQLWFDVESRYEATKMHAKRQKKKLWFDVESRYEATIRCFMDGHGLLWFDVESRYEATRHELQGAWQQVVVWCRIKIWSNRTQHVGRHHLLWFDVESRYEATVPSTHHTHSCCGLM